MVHLMRVVSNMDFTITLSSFKDHMVRVSYGAPYARSVIRRLYDQSAVI